MKKIILAFGIFILAIFVNGYSEGQIITQEQVNRFDTNLTYSEVRDAFQCQTISTGEKIYHAHAYYWVVIFSCFNVEEYGDRYIIRTNTYYPAFKIAEYKQCVSKQGKDFCVERYTGYIRRASKNKIMGILGVIKSYQDDYSDEDTEGLAGDIW